VLLVTFWFSDKMLFTEKYTETFGEWRLAQQRVKRWSKNAFFTRKNDVHHCQSLMVTDVALKLDCASVILIDHGVQID